MTTVRDHAQRSGRRRRTETVVLFAVANQEFAISADSVQEIRSTDGLAGAANEIEQPVLPKVRHIIEHGHRTYYVVNAGVHFELPVSRPALLLMLRDSHVAVLIDRIERMTQISSLYPLPLAFRGEERRWYRGLAYVDDAVIPLVHAEGFLTPEECELLDRAAKADAAQQAAEGAVPA